METIYQYTFQSDAFQVLDAFQAISYPVSAAIGMLQVEGSTVFLESYFKNTDLYIGLWSGSTPTTSATLSGFTQEVVYSDYERITIPKNDFVFIPEERRMYTNRKYSFSPRIQNWSADGYFIATTSDNTGILIDVVKFKKTETIEPFKYLNIQPAISIHGQTANRQIVEVLVFDYLADGTYYAGNPSEIQAHGGITHTLVV